MRQKYIVEVAIEVDEPVTKGWVKLQVQSSLDKSLWEEVPIHKVRVRKVDKD